MPSNAARARCSGFIDSRRSPASVPAVCGRLGVRSPSRYGSSTRPWAPGVDFIASSDRLSRSGSPSSSAVPRRAVRRSGWGRPAGGMPVASARDGDHPGLGRRAPRWCTAMTGADAPSDTTASPEPDPQPEGGGHGLAGAGGDQQPLRRRTGRARRGRSPRAACAVMPERQLDEVRCGSRRSPPTSSRCRRRRRGRWSGAARPAEQLPAPASRAPGAVHRRSARRRCRLVLGQPAQLGHGLRRPAVPHATACGPSAARPPSASTRSAAATWARLSPPTQCGAHGVALRRPAATTALLLAAETPMACTPSRNPAAWPPRPGRAARPAGSTSVGGPRLRHREVRGVRPAGARHRCPASQTTMRVKPRRSCPSRRLSPCEPRATPRAGARALSGAGDAVVRAVPRAPAGSPADAGLRCCWCPSRPVPHRPCSRSAASAPARATDVGQPARPPSRVTTSTALHRQPAALLGAADSAVLRTAGFWRHPDVPTCFSCSYRSRPARAPEHITRVQTPRDERRACSAWRHPSPVSGLCSRLPVVPGTATELPIGGAPPPCANVCVAASARLWRLPSGAAFDATRRFLL